MASGDAIWFATSFVRLLKMLENARCRAECTVHLITFLNAYQGESVKGSGPCNRYVNEHGKPIDEKIWLEGPRALYRAYKSSALIFLVWSIFIVAPSFEVQQVHTVDLFMNMAKVLPSIQMPPKWTQDGDRWWCDHRCCHDIDRLSKHKEGGRTGFGRC